MNITKENIASLKDFKAAKKLAKENSITLTATDLEGAQAEFTATLDSSDDDEQDETVVAPTAAQILAGLDKSMEPQEGDKATSPYINKSVIGGKTVDITLLLNKDFVAVRQERVSNGPSDHAAFHFVFNGQPKHGFLTKAEYDLIKSTKKVCDIPAVDELVDKYAKFLDKTHPEFTEESRVVAAVKLRMALTDDGAVKAA